MILDYINEYRSDIISIIGISLTMYFGYRESTKEKSIELNKKWCGRYLARPKLYMLDVLHEVAICISFGFFMLAVGLAILFAYSPIAKLIFLCIFFYAFYKFLCLSFKVRDMISAALDAEAVNNAVRSENNDGK